MTSNEENEYIRCGCLLVDFPEGETIGPTEDFTVCQLHSFTSSE